MRNWAVKLNVNAAAASYETILFYLQKSRGLETSFKLRDHNCLRPRQKPVRKGRDQDRDYKKIGLDTESPESLPNSYEIFISFLGLARSTTRTESY